MQLAAILMLITAKPSRLATNGWMRHFFQRPYIDLRAIDCLSYKLQDMGSSRDTKEPIFFNSGNDTAFPTAVFAQVRRHSRNSKSSANIITQIIYSRLSALPSSRLIYDLNERNIAF
jgi:hypothetical protein